MKISTEFNTSPAHLPLIIDDDGQPMEYADGQPMEYADGIKAIRAKLELSTEQLGAACGVSRRTVEGWEQGRTPSLPALRLLNFLLAPVQRK